jgi:cell division protein FtsB
MAKTKFTPQKLARLESRIRLIKGTNRLLYLFTALSFGSLVIASAYPQKRENDKLQARLRNTQDREQATLDIKEHREIELHALREDRAYLEIHARDRLNYYREGEKVLRFDRNR